MNDLVTQYTAGNVVVTILDVGNTWEQNITIKCLKIHLNEGLSSGSKDAIAYVGGLGAQPLTVNKVFYNVEFILSRIETDSGIKRALHFNDVYAIPMVNHDAYKDLTDNWINRQLPYFQKNKQSNVATCITDDAKSGINLYYNFPYKFDNSGAVTECSDNYPGAAAEDANEVKALVDFFQDKRLALYESYIGVGTSITKPYTWKGDPLAEIDAYYFDTVVSQYGTVVESFNTWQGSDIDYFQSVNVLSMWVDLGLEDWPSNPGFVVDDYDDLLKHNLYYMTDLLVNPIIDFDDKICDLSCSETDEISEPISLMEFKYKVQNAGLTNSAAVQIAFDLNYDTEQEDALYNLKLHAVYERTKIIAANSEWTNLVENSQEDEGGNHAVSFVLTKSALARRTDYEWTIVVEKSENLLNNSKLKDISSNLTIDFQLVDAATKEELAKYGYNKGETVTIGKTALGYVDNDDDKDDKDDKDDGGSGGGDDDGLSEGAVVAIVVIVVIVVLVIIGVIVVWVIKKSKHSSGENYAGNQEMHAQQPGNILPPSGTFQYGPSAFQEAENRPPSPSNQD